MSHEVGEAVESIATFTDRLGNLVNPATVKFTFKRPNETVETVWVYGVDAQVIRDSIGKYRVVLTLDTYSRDSDWQCRWSCAGSTIQRVKNFKIRVAKPELASPP